MVPLLIFDFLDRLWQRDFSSMSKDECSLGGDRMVLGPELGDGSRPCIRHLPDHQIQTGVVQLLKEGQSLNGYDEVVAIKYDYQRGDYEVESVYNSGHPPIEEVLAASNGPAKVNSDAYRAGYERIFGKSTVGEA